MRHLRIRCIRKIVLLAVVFGLNTEAQNSNSSSEKSVVDYSLAVQNNLPFGVTTRSVWKDGAESQQKLAPCEWKLLKYPNAKYRYGLFRTKTSRSLLEKLYVSNRDLYQVFISGPRFENIASKNKSFALEFSLENKLEIVNLKPLWFRCIRLLNNYDFPVNISLYYSDESKNEFAINSKQIINFGTVDLGIFEREPLTFWNLIRNADHNIQVKRLVVRNANKALLDLARKEIRREFRIFYRRPSSSLGTCMSLDEKGFSFIGRCGEIAEECNRDGCRFIQPSSATTRGS